MTLQPGERLGPLEVVAALGSGGMGEVYRARDTRLDRDVAVKVLPDELSGNAERLSRLEQEARSLASLSHPNVAVVYGLEEHQGKRCILMELVPGVTLAEKLERGPLPVAKALDVCRQLAEALEAAHAAGVIHRDLKPSNVKVTPEGRVKLLDFGLAKAPRGDDSDSLMPTDSPVTREGVVMGTAAYMSPEQARSQELDKRSDIWSFGCVMYETLTGRRAFPADTLSDTIVALLEREPDWNGLPAATPPSVRSLVQKCLQKDKARRLHDVADARIELEDALAAKPSSSPISAAGSAGRRSRLSRPAWVGLVAALALLAAALWVLRPRAPAPLTTGLVTLAVLPFHVVGDASAQDDLGLGLADDIITHLANTAELRVRPTQAVLRYQANPSEPQEAGRALGVDSVLSGTIRRQPGGTRVTAQLVRVADGASFWGASYDLASNELPGLEDRITGEVAQALGLLMSGPAKARNERRFTENAAAYEAYLRGRASMVYGSEKGTQAAIAAFEEALRLDPDYALAHGGLSMASAQMHLRFASAAEAPAWRERALREAERAAALDGELGETHQALADVYGKTEFEWDRVFLESRRALALNSSLHLPHAYLSRAFYHLGLLERADQEARAALAVEPDGVDGVRALGITHFLAGRFQEAVPRLEEVQRLSGKPLSDYYLALAYYYSGDTRRGEAVLEELTRASSASNAQRARSWLAAFLAARGERARSEELVAQVAAGQFMDHHVAAGLGDAHAQLGRTDDAMRWLQEAADTGFPCRRWYASDSLLQPLRGSPAFQAWLDELERQEAEARRLHDRP